MPLSAKGAKIIKAMREQYGQHKGTRVFWASVAKKKMTGVESKGSTH